MVGELVEIDEVGKVDGRQVGAIEGAADGAAVGATVGLNVGAFEGATEEGLAEMMSSQWWVGAAVGRRWQWLVGAAVGTRWQCCGIAVGAVDVGSLVGFAVGE